MSTSSRPFSVWVLEAILLFLAIMPVVAIATTLAHPGSVVDPNPDWQRLAPFFLHMVFRVALFAVAFGLVHSRRPVGRLVGPAVLVVLYSAPSLLSAARLALGPSSVFSATASGATVGAFSAATFLGGVTALLAARVILGGREKAYFSSGSSSPQSQSDES